MADIPRRLNGRPQACDPCRLRKVACDHGQPVCGRCSRLGRRILCHYTASRTPADSSPPTLKASTPVKTRNRPSQVPPVSKHAPASKGRASPSRRLQTGRDPTAATPGVTSSSGITQSGSHYNIRGNASTEPLTVPPRGIIKSGYLGPTSHSAVFEEAVSNLGLTQGPHAWLPKLNDYSRDAVDRDPRVALNSPTRESCLLVLRSIPTTPHTHLRPRWHLHSDFWLFCLGLRALRDVQDRYGTHLDSKSDSELDDISLFLSQNSARPLSEDVASYEEWSDQLLGDNLRWESIGLLFAFRDFMQNASGTFEDDQNRPVSNTCRLVARYCLSLCIDISRRFTDGNLMLLHLCKRRSTEESMLSGDASASTWRCHGSAMTLLSYMGLHAIPCNAKYTPTFCSELKRRIYALVFVIDKIVVLFTGRPPILSHRYCTTPLLLDLEDSVLQAGGQVLADAVRELDDRGWNTKGELHPATMLRARHIFAVFRDELIEHALCDRTRTPSTVDAILDIKRRQKEAIAHFPSSLNYNPADSSDPNEVASRTFCRTVVRLEHLQNIFVAERLLVKRGQPDDGNLLATSYHLVALTLTFWLRQDRYAEMAPDFQWLVMAYGAPGGGIMCMELLNPTFTGTHPLDPQITRSSIVQQLSLLVGFLAWVGPTAPNAEISSSCKAVIQHVLDKTLNGALQGEVEGAERADGWMGNMADLDGRGLDLEFNFDVMDTFDWLKPDMLSSMDSGGV